MSKYDIGNTSYSAFMNEKEGRYTVLVNKAELTNRNNGGIATAEEGNFYREAVEVCDEIINRNLSQKAVVSIWKSKKKMCADEIDRIVNELKKVKAEEQKNEIPVGAGKPADSAKTSQISRIRRLLLPQRTLLTALPHAQPAWQRVRGYQIPHSNSPWCQLLRNPRRGSSCSVKRKVAPCTFH